MSLKEKLLRNRRKLIPSVRDLFMFGRDEEQLCDKGSLVLKMNRNVQDDILSLKMTA
jgi:hypothetical protein